MTASLKAKNNYPVRSSANGMPQYLAMVVKTPARRNQVSRTSELKDYSEGTNKEEPFTLADKELLQSEEKSKSITPGPNLSIKKDLRNKSKKIGQVQSSRRFNTFGINAPVI